MKIELIAKTIYFNKPIKPCEEYEFEVKLDERIIRANYSPGLGLPRVRARENISISKEEEKKIQYSIIKLACKEGWA